MANIIICKIRTISRFILLAPFLAGCGHVAGNYPPLLVDHHGGVVHLIDGGFEAEAGPRLELDRIRADLGLLRAQGFSPRDPQILRSIAHRERVPVSLIGERTDAEYYRVRFRVTSGSKFVLRPGAVTLLLDTGKGTRQATAEGFLIEDHRLATGCRSAGESGLVLGGSRSEMSVLVRAGLRGRIVGINIEPHMTLAGESGTAGDP